MAKRKNVGSDEVRYVDRYHRSLTPRPLFGLERLVNTQRRKQSGVLLCDSISTTTDTVSFSESNARPHPFHLRYTTSLGGFLGEPQTSVVNEASPLEMERFRDYGREFEFHFNAERGKTYSVTFTTYRPLESYHSGIVCLINEITRVENYVLTVDLSAYVAAGYSIDTPLCEYKQRLTNGVGSSKGKAKSRPRRLNARERSPGHWEWRVRDMCDGVIRAAWMAVDPNPTRVFGSLDFDKLAMELSVNASTAKDLHNFVTVCQFFAADVRSLNAIDHRMLASKTALSRSLEAIEQAVGAELIERSRGRGLVRITPAGEAVLEWWSRFYMRWTPIFLQPEAAKQDGRPRGGRES